VNLFTLCLGALCTSSEENGRTNKHKVNAKLRKILGKLEIAAF